MNEELTRPKPEMPFLALTKTIAEVQGGKGCHGCYKELLGEVKRVGTVANMYGLLGWIVSDLVELMYDWEENQNDAVIKKS